jgi:hypothetical protein
VVDGKTPTIMATVLTGKAGYSLAVAPTADRLFVGDCREGALTRLSAPDSGTITSWS